VCSCGHRRPIKLVTMYVLTGASGAGKSTIGDELLGRVSDLVVLEADILWAPEMDIPEDGYARFRSTWLRLAANIHQSGTSTLLVGSGVPEQFETRPERRYVGAINWVALVCDDDLLEQRLRARPRWRGVTPESIATMKRFNRELRARGDIDVLDNTDQTIDETREAVLAWLGTQA